MTDLAVAQIATCENASTPPPAKPRFMPGLRRFMPRLGLVPRLTLIGVLSIFAAVAVAIWASVKITEGEMYQRAQINLSINIKLLAQKNSALVGQSAGTAKTLEREAAAMSEQVGIFRIDADEAAEAVAAQSAV
jgi:hypothetical protein